MNKSLNLFRTTVICAVVALSACAPQSTGSGVGAGSEVPSTKTVVALFRGVCLNTEAKHSRVRAIIPQPPFLLNGEQDIYYHQRYNLSFRPVRIDGVQSCSLVAASYSPDQLNAALEAAGRAKGLRVATRKPDELKAPDGTYINAVAVGR